jgi:histone acetyltransferase (RNA polymerase elongator complex component)
MRAFLNQFDAVKQVWNRLQSLTLTGHTPDKIEMTSRLSTDNQICNNFICVFNA